MKKSATIQNIKFQENDQFQVGDDSSIYTFIEVVVENGIEWLKAENEFDSISSFRIDMMKVHGLWIRKI